MTVITVPKITEDDLKKTFIDFGPENGKKICEKYFGNFTNRELGELMKYIMRGRNITFPKRMLKKGRLRVSRFKNMCDGSDIDPKEIISEYTPRVVQLRGYGHFVEVEEPLKDATLNAICDGL